METFLLFWAWWLSKNYVFRDDPNSTLGKLYANGLYWECIAHLAPRNSTLPHEAFY